MIFVEVLLFGGLLALANLAGGALLIVPRGVRGRPTLVRNFVAAGAGFMLAAVFLEILPETLQVWLGDSGANTPDVHQVGVAMALVLCGYLVVHTGEYLFATHLHPAPPAAAGEAGAHGGLQSATVYAAIGGLCVHTFFDGVTLATGFLVDFRFGVLIFIAVLLHKIPEGMTAASVMLAGGGSGRKAMIATAYVASATLLGVLVVLLLPLDTEIVIKYALPLSAGVTLYIAASDLIPEISHHHRRSLLVPAFVVGGVLVFYLLHLAVGH